MTDPKGTKNKPKSLGEILSSYFSALSGPAADHSVDSGAKPDRKQQNSRLLSILKPVTWILTALFIFSFYWDFQGVILETGMMTLQFEGLLRIVSISGLIGFLTNRIAITMLFHPVKKRPLLGHGLIPAHKESIAARLAKSVSEDLINPDLIRQKVDQSQAISRYRGQMVNSIREVLEMQEFRSDLKLWLSETITDFISDPRTRAELASGIAEQVETSVGSNTIDRTALKAYMLVRGRQMQDIVDDALRGLPEKLTNQASAIDTYLDQFPDFMEKNSATIDQVAASILDKLIRQLDVQKIVEENLRAYDEKKLEAMIKGVTNEQLLTIQYLGAILGTIGGFVIWEPLLSLTIITLIATTIYTTDRILSK